MSDMTGFHILVVDDEQTVRDVVVSRFERRGFRVDQAVNADAALDLLAKESKIEAVICDLRMPGKDGFAVIGGAKVPVILITGHGDKECAIRAVREGAFGFFEKPFDLDALEVQVMRACERRRWEIERRELLARLKRDNERKSEVIAYIERSALRESEMVGESPAMNRVKSDLQKLAKKPTATALLLGETGTGKEVAARELHRWSFGERAEGVPFLAWNCAAIPRELMESELFGHEKGSFTGALATRLGLAEAVGEGTLFLDEIGDLEIGLQAKLLRLIESRTFRRVGSNKDQVFRGRILAATHRDLNELVREGKFREDLFYRLSVVTVVLPPLRERGWEDVRALAMKFCERHGLVGWSPELEALMCSYAWPGNIRELHNWIERAAILGHHTPSLLIHTFASSKSDQLASDSKSDQVAFGHLENLSGGLKMARERILSDLDRHLITSALMRAEGNISEAARQLHLDRKNLAKRMNELGISPNSPSLSLSKSESVAFGAESDRLAFGQVSEQGAEGQRVTKKKAA